MFRSRIFNRGVVAVLGLCTLAMAACDREEALDVPVPERAPVPDIVDEGAATAGYAFLPGNPFHDKKMEVLLDRPDVSALVDAFAGRGMRLSPGNSITVTGGDGHTGVWATLIALDGGERSAIIACYGSGDRFGLAPVEFALDSPPGGDEWKPFVGKGWYSEPEFGRIPRSSQRWEPFEWWDWGFFGRCLAERAPVASATCALECVWVPGYWHCFLYCSVAKALGATVGCIMDMYRWGGNEFKED
jgi:hypothetical protein